MATTEEILDIVRRQFPSLNLQAAPLVTRSGIPGDQWYIRIEPANLLDVMRFLHDDERLRFDHLADLAGLDYLNFPNATDRYGVVYTLRSTTLNHNIWVKCFANDPEPKMPSVTSIWQGANWMEREVYDLIGVTFEGHPDMRRMFLWDGFGSHPLRKDYPLTGKGERENYEVVDRDSA